MSAVESVATDASDSVTTIVAAASTGAATSSPQGTSWRLIVGIVVGVFAFFALLIFIFWLAHRLRNHPARKDRDAASITSGASRPDSRPVSVFSDSTIESSPRPWRLRRRSSHAATPSLRTVRTRDEHVDPEPLSPAHAMQPSSPPFNAPVQPAMKQTASSSPYRPGPNLAATYPPHVEQLFTPRVVPYPGGGNPPRSPPQAQVRPSRGPQLGGYAGAAQRAALNQGRTSVAGGMPAVGQTGSMNSMGGRVVAAEAYDDLGWRGGRMQV
ncbi:hypothetical protein JCM1840_004463 [Sporobolomyces johnsonii]